MSQWADILSWEQLKANHDLTASLDPAFANRELCFWTSRTVKQLQVLKAQAWNVNDGEQWQKARSYLALSGVTP
jgi:hypothetical protein